MIEHLVGQELLSMQHDALSTLHFWIRDKKTSQAELDYIFPFEGKLIPIEVKSGAVGKLKSSNLYMDEAPHNMAIRFYAGKVNISEVITPAGKKYKLLNLPYFLASQTIKYIEWFDKELSGKKK